MDIDGLWLTRQDVPDLCKLLKRDRRTVEGWFRKREFPFIVTEYLKLLNNGDLRKLHSDWDGWKLDTRTGELVTNTGERITTGQILSYPYKHQLVSEYQRRIAILEDELEASARRAALPLAAFAEPPKRIFYRSSKKKVSRDWK